LPNRFVAGLEQDRCYPYSARAAAASLASAIAATKPALIVPGDDSVLAGLLALHKRHHDAHQKADDVAQLIERSFGNPDAHTTLLQRTAFIESAAAIGIHALESRVIASKDSLAQTIREFGCPIVLKLDKTSGGSGTVIATDLADALSKRRMLISAMWRIRKHIGALLRSETSTSGLHPLRSAPVLNAQRFVRGSPATTAFACWKGQILAAVHAQVLQEAYPRGPATVVRTILNDEMDINARKIAHRFKLSGVHGLDYVMDEATGRPWLIEINPRLTQIAHFGLGKGRDLATSLVAALIGTELAPRPPKIKSDVVVLFPQEWLRDPKSAFLASGYHDVPWHNPKFVESVLGNERGKEGVPNIELSA
jgi:hypothetical protein